MFQDIIFYICLLCLPLAGYALGRLRTLKSVLSDIRSSSTISVQLIEDYLEKKINS